MGSGSHVAENGVSSRVVACANVENGVSSRVVACAKARGHAKARGQGSQRHGVRSRIAHPRKQEGLPASSVPRSCPTSTETAGGADARGHRRIPRRARNQGSQISQVTREQPPPQRDGLPPAECERTQMGSARTSPTLRHGAMLPRHGPHRLAPRHLLPRELHPQ